MEAADDSAATTKPQLVVKMEVDPKTPQNKRGGHSEAPMALNGRTATSDQKPDRIHPGPLDAYGQERPRAYRTTFLKVND